MHTEWACQNTAIFGTFCGTNPAADQVIAAPCGFCACGVRPSPTFISTSKLCHNGVSRIPFAGRIEAIGKPPD
jgi:hypothetical protein